jgi:predicted PurR-regulated permease PerM
MLGVVVAASVVTILTFVVLFRLGIKYTLTLGFILGVITASLYANALRDWDSSVFFQTRAFYDEKFDDCDPSAALLLAILFL